MRLINKLTIKGWLAAYFTTVVSVYSYWVTQPVNPHFILMDRKSKSFRIFIEYYIYVVELITFTQWENHNYKLFYKYVSYLNIESGLDKFILFFQSFKLICRKIDRER